MVLLSRIVICSSKWVRIMSKTNLFQRWFKLNKSWVTGGHWRRRQQSFHRTHLRMSVFSSFCWNYWLSIVNSIYQWSTHFVQYPSCHTLHSTVWQTKGKSCLSQYLLLIVSIRQKKHTLTPKYQFGMVCLSVIHPHWKYWMCLSLSTRCVSH